MTAAPPSNTRYLFALGLVIASVLLLCGATNYVVDPYRLIREKGGLVRALPYDLSFEREIRFNLITARRPGTLFFGASQVAVGFDPADPAVPDRQAFNAAIDGGSLIEGIRLLGQAVAVGKVRRIVLGISYNMSTHEDVSRIHDLFLSAPQGPFRLAKAFLSTTMLRSSLKAVSEKLAGIPSDMNESGLLSEAVMIRQTDGYGGVRAAFDRMKIPATGNVTEFIGSLGRFLAIACGSRAEVAVALLPDHAANLELFAATGQWDLLKQWKRGVVNIDAHASCPVRTVDFEDYNFVSTEPLPPEGSRHRMKYYWDPGHFTTATGALILARMFGPESALSSGSFGYDISPANIEDRLRKLDEQRRAYEAADPSGVLSILGHLSENQR